MQQGNAFIAGHGYGKIRRFGTTRTSEESAQVNLTPMLDVVFIMLIFFIVTAVFVREQGLDVSPPLPDITPPPDVKERPILVDVLPNRRLLVNGKDVDERLLGAQLARLHAQQPKAAVVLRPGRDATTEMVVLVMDQARQQGIATLNFATR